MNDGPNIRLTASENDALALRWAGPFGYAVLQVLRQTEHYGEADFQVLMARGSQLLAHQGIGLIDEATLRVRQMIPEGGPPVSAATVAGRVLEPAPPASHYKRVGVDRTGRTVRQR